MYNTRKSIIIVNHNGQHYLSNCLRSLLECENPDETEIIVIDNASTDDSLLQISKNFPDITLIQSSKNNGFGYANNMGAQRATGEFLFFLNPDTVVTQGWSDRLILSLDADPSIGMVTPKILLLSQPARLNACGHRVHYTGVVQCRGLGQPKNNFELEEEIDAVSGAAFCIRRVLFETLNGFDAPFFLFIEDTDLSWRIWLAGYKCKYIPDSIIYHDYSLCFASEKIFYYERNRYQLLLKNLKWRTLLVLLPGLFVTEIVSWGFVFFNDRKQWRNKRNAYIWVFNNWRNILSERDSTKKHRKIKDRDLLSLCRSDLAFNQVSDQWFIFQASRFFNTFFRVYNRFLSILIRW